MTEDRARSLEQLWLDEGPRLQQWLGNHVSPETAEDMTAEAFYRLAMESGDTATDRHLWRIATTRLTNHLKAETRVPELLPLHEGRAGSARSFPTADVAVFRADFTRALRSLPKEERDAFAAIELRGLTQREAADLLGVSQPTIARRLDRASTLLREELS